MSITVRFFASLREQFGAGEKRVETDSSGMTVNDVWRAVSEQPQLPPNVLSAVNLEYARAADTVNDGDEVAFFPPVTGG